MDPIPVTNRSESETESDSRPMGQLVSLRPLGRSVPWLASSYSLTCLGTIPYGAPPSNSFILWLGLAGVAIVGLARASAGGRWTGISIWPVLAILGAMAISIASCRLPGLAFSRSTSFGVFAVLAIIVQVARWDQRAFRLVLWGVFAAMVAITTDVAWQRLTGYSRWTGQVGDPGGRLSGSHGNANDLAAAPLLLPLVLAAIPTCGPAWRRLTLGTITAVMAGVPVVLSASRQAAIAWVVGLGVMMGGGRGWHWRRALWGLSAIAVTAVAVVWLSPALQHRAVQTMRQGFDIREQLTVYGLELFTVAPVTGIGPGLFGQYYKVSATEGWEWRGVALPRVGMPWVHSLPVEILCELGLVGAAAYGAVLFVVVRRAWRCRAAGHPDSRLAWAILATLAAGSLAGLVDLSFIKDWVRCEFWLVVGLAMSLRQRTPVHEDDRQVAAVDHAVIVEVANR